MLLEALSTGIIPAVLLVSALILVLKIREINRNFDERVLASMKRSLEKEILERKLREPLKDELKK
tara:strand:- start:9 stop:203 length:195 start_codon:yes stop_codon:yes gene_type:complete